MSEQSFEMIAKTFQGLEEVLAQELTALGANEIEIGRRMVSFSGDKEMMYKANFCLRTAIRILKPIKHFTAKDADEVYEQIKAIRWEDYLDTDKTFAVDAVVFSEEFRHSKFVSYKVKDAIVDYFREKTGERPGVRVNKPDVLLNIHIAETKCTLSLDSSGESLHRRGYRQEAVEAPLNEVLAAGMILMTGWRGECDLIEILAQAVAARGNRSARIGLAVEIFQASIIISQSDKFLYWRVPENILCSANILTLETQAMCRDLFQQFLRALDTVINAPAHFNFSFLRPSGTIAPAAFSLFFL